MQCLREKYLRLRFVGQLLRETAAAGLSDNVFRLSAALSFYATASLAPMLLIVVAISTSLMESGTVQDEVMRWIGILIGRDGQRIVLTVSESAAKDAASTGALISAGLTMLLGATAMFNELQDGLNTIWRVKVDAGATIRRMLYQRFVAFLMVLCLAGLLLMSVVASAALAALDAMLSETQVFATPLAIALGWIIFLFVGAALVGATYKLLPAAVVTWREALAGGMVTSVLFVIGQSLFGLYLGTSSLKSLYGAAGSFVLVLLWLYYCAVMYFFGAEFARLYGMKRSKDPVYLGPSETA